MLSKEEACKEMRGGLPRKWKTFLWSQSFPPEHNIEYQWGSQYWGFSFKIFEKISKPVPVGVEYLNQVILVDGWKTWSSSFTFLFYCWSSSSQFHQPTCCFSSEAGNLSRAFSADFMTQFLPSQDPRDPTDKIVITAIGLRLRMTQCHSWLTVIMVYLANLFNVLYIHDIETDWVDPFTQPSQYWECDEKYDDNFSRV